jgi:hypothetical protein
MLFAIIHGRGSMSYYRACFLALCALPAISATALAQNQNQNQNKNQTQNQIQKPAVVQQKPAAIQQLQYSNQGNAQRNHVFEGTQKPANPVQATSGIKPSPVGLPVHSTPGNPGFKPAQPSLHTNPVPSPTIARSTTTATSPPAVARSSTTATVQPAKKP